MTTHDLVVRGAMVIDGTGAPRFEADVAVSNGVITHIGGPGEVAGEAHEELGGHGLILAPGWIDTHTHLDANLFWDPDLTPPSRYGVTTVVIANCGYGLAPILDDAAREYVIDALVAVEQIPRAAIEAGVDFSWTDLASYAKVLCDLPSLCNRAFLVGHLPVRTAVMGPDAAHERAATPAEVDRMCALVAEGLELGAVGFSTDQVVGNFGPHGQALPGQVCADEELLAIARTLGNGPGPGLFTMAPRALLLDRAARTEDLAWHERLAEASGRPVVIGPVFDTFDDPGIGIGMLDAIADAQARGHRVIGQVSPRPFELWTRLDAPGVMVRALPTLYAALKEGGAEGIERLAHDEDTRSRLREEGANIEASLVFSGRWDHVHVRYSPSHPEVRDRDVASLARERSTAPTDVLLSLALDDEFETQFAIAMRSPDDIRLGKMVAHPAAQIGGSDAGAHTQSNTDSCYAVWTLQHWVRERSVLTWEEAIRKLTGAQAELFGLHDRGVIQVGKAADLVLVDPDRVGVSGVRFVADQPAGGTRLVADAQGIVASVVNGVLATLDGSPTGARPGRLLSGN